jgi:hypothetical protein
MIARMQLAPALPRPRALPNLGGMTAPATPLDRSQLPDDVGEGVNLDVATSATNEWGPIDDQGWYAAISDYSTSYRAGGTGLVDALASAQSLVRSEGHEAMAVVQSAIDGARYVVPLGVWNPNDESELRFEDVNGPLHYTSASDYMLLRPSRQADVEAVVFADGASWINLTGHPERLPEGASS